MDVAFCELAEGGWLAAGDLLEVVAGDGAVAGDDGPGEPAQHIRVVGRDAHGQCAADPGFLVDVVVDDGSAGHSGDDVGGLTEGEGLRAGERVLRPGGGAGGPAGL